MRIFSASGSVVWMFLVFVYVGGAEWSVVNRLPQSTFYIALSTALVPLTYTVIRYGEDLSIISKYLTEEFSGSVKDFFGSVFGSIMVNGIVSVSVYLLFSIGAITLGDFMGFFTYRWDTGLMFLLVQVLLIAASLVGLLIRFQR